MKTYTFEVSRRVVVQLDQAKFTAQLMAEFDGSITDYSSAEDPEYAMRNHAERIAMIYARGDEDFMPSDFVEGYGPVAEAGITVTSDGTYDYIEQVFPIGDARSKNGGAE